MPKQTVYLVLFVYEGEDPTPMQIYDNRASAEQHAAFLNSRLGGEEDSPVFIFTVREWRVLSEFIPHDFQTAAQRVDPDRVIRTLLPPILGDLLALAVLLALIATLIFLPAFL